MKKLNLEIELTDNTLDNIIKMAPYLDEKSQDRVFGMMLEAVKSLEKEQKAGQKWDSKWKEGKDVKKRPKKRKDFDDLIFWPVFILWIIFALAKIIIDFGLIT